MRLLTLIIKTKITEGNSVICDGEKRALGARARDIVSSIGFGERKRGRVGFRHYARSNESTSGLCKRGSSSKLYRNQRENGNICHCTTKKNFRDYIYCSMMLFVEGTSVIHTSHISFGLSFYE
ncbi:uncharacterized protein LOC133821032 isoform X1 [Humulus lupulus]|uniref:uncharacterized protein LOC133821032 isoform X1 n=1 Tax=Humulus lupulus TaxID=3486 RepID=UPI002B418450|nr:uncharacterized protein LOC133821032 isoform X1 [Humulus lupulus]